MDRRSFLASLAATSSLGAVSEFQLVDITKSAGISFSHNSGAFGRKYLPETLGPGCAFLDYDNDGWMDLLLVNSGPCDFFAPKKRLNHALYKNNRDGTFTDVTEKAGLTAQLFAMGVVVGDYDND